jgi:transcriptional regulator with XRE-family HTH domain
MMNDPRLGTAVRALRRRRRWRQKDLGATAGVSQPVISAIEAGRIDRMSIAVLRSVAAALDAAVTIELRWHGGALEQLIDQRHARIVGATVEMLDRLGWAPEVEVSYSHYGERGSIDVLAWHASAATLLVVEVKSELVSIEATLRKLDEKARLAPVVSRERHGGRPVGVGRLLILPATTTARRQLARNGSVLDAALPMRGDTVRGWLRHPVGSISGILLLPDRSDIAHGDGRQRPATPRRVRIPRPRTGPRAPGRMPIAAETADR